MIDDLEFPEGEWVDEPEDSFYTSGSFNAIVMNCNFGHRLIVEIDVDSVEQGKELAMKFLEMVNEKSK